jgi:chemotaxis protein MotB
MGKKSKVQLDPPDESETWIYSFADMMSLLLGFFIIFFSISQSAGQQAEEIKKRILETFKNQKKDQVSESKVGFVNETKQINALNLLIATINFNDSEGEESKSKKMGPSEREQEGGAPEKSSKSDEEEMTSKIFRFKEPMINIVLPNKISFLPGSAKLTKPARKQITKLASIFSSSNKLNSIEITGHTDSINPSNRAKYINNWSLSAARAGAIAQILVKNGVSPKLVRARGVADSEPLYPNFDKHGRLIKKNLSANRRVEILLKKRDLRK